MASEAASTTLAQKGRPSRRASSIGADDRMNRARVREELLLGGPDAPVVLRHVVVAGSNTEVGRAVAELAIERYGLSAEALLSDGRYVRARRAYFQRTYPIHWQRMRGVAAAFGLQAEDDRFDFSILPVRPFAEVGQGLPCAATYRPPWTNDTGHGLLSQSCEVRGARPELYVMEWYGTRSGHASIALHAFDLLSGTLQGVNRAGLIVSTVAGDAIDDRGARRSRAERGLACAVGLHELQLMRFVLDTCTTVDEAQAALLGARDFWIFAPARYLIADSSGRSFAYESPLGHGIQCLVDAEAEPQTIGPPDPSPEEGPRGGAGRPPTPRWACIVDQKRLTLDLGNLIPEVGLGQDHPSLLAFDLEPNHQRRRAS